MGETAPGTIGETSISVGNPWVFFATTFAITWGFWSAAIVLGVRFDSAVGLLLLLSGLTGPGAAGIGFVYLVYGERGRRDFWERVRQVRRIGVRWLLVILLLAPAIAISAASIELLSGGTSATLGDWVYEVDTNPAAFLPTLAFSTIAPLLEELGWRGYALDRLQLDRSAMVSGVLLGVVWAIWHLPLFFIEGSYQHDMVGFGTLEFWMFMIGIVPVSVAMTWVYNNTSRSILAAILMHGWANFTLQSVELTGRSEVFHIAIWFVAVAVVTAVWGARTLRNDRGIPHPPLPSRETASE